MVWTQTGSSAVASTIADIDDLNTYLGESDTTDAKTAAIEAACSYIESYTGRTWGSAVRREWHNLKGSKTLITDVRPITGIYRLCYTTEDALRIGSTDTTYTRGSVSVANGSMILTRAGSTAAADDSDTLTLASYDTITELAAAIVALANNWTATVVHECEPSALMPAVYADAIPGPVSILGPNGSIETYSVDAKPGIVTVGSQGWVYIEYQGGEAVPAVLTEVACQMAAQSVKNSTINLSLASERIGDYSYTTKTSSGTTTETTSNLSIYGSILDQFVQRSL